MDLISYETIRTAHRAEKDETLQKLPENFFQSVRTWLATKSARGDTASLLEVENAKKLIEDLINRRERKIMMSALRAVRGSSPPVGMTNSEMIFFDKMVVQLNDFRTITTENIIGPAAMAEEKVMAAVESVAALPKPQLVQPPLPKNGHTLVKMLSDLPRFVGTDMNSYGPLKNGDMITLPADTANMLFGKGMAETVLG